MAATVVTKGTAYTTGGTATDTHVLDLPNSLVTGNRIIIGFVKRAANGGSGVTWPGSPAWTELNLPGGGTQGPLAIPTSGGTCEYRYHDIDGTEGWTDGSSITLMSPTSTKAVGFQWQIEDHDPGTAPQIATTTASTSTAPDPPSLTPSWGSADNLWIATWGINQNQTTSSYPTNYADNQVDTVSTGASANGLGVCSRALTASSEDPGAATITGAGSNLGIATIAVRPSVGDTVLANLVTLTPSVFSPSVGLGVAANLITLTPTVHPAAVGAPDIVLANLVTLTPTVPSPSVGLGVAASLVTLTPSVFEPGVAGGSSADVLLSQIMPPFYEGGAVSSNVPGEYPVALAGHAYMFEPKLYRRTFIPLQRDTRDDSEEPGEQTLSPEGLWRRSQSDWSLGAGQEWLDEADSLRERFNTSIGVDVFNERQACLLPATEEKLSVTATNLKLLAVGGYLYATNGSALRFGTDPTTVDWSAFSTATGLPGSDILDITSSGAHVYVVGSDNSIYRATPGTVGFGAAWLNPAEVVTRIWYAIGRLFVSDGPNLYHVTASGPTVDATDVFAHPLADAVISDLVGGPTGVYFTVNVGQNSEVRHFKVDDDGATFTAPVSVATFINEQIHCIEMASAALIVGTSLGFRFALVSDSSGLTFGPAVTTPGAVRCLTVDTIGAETFFWFGWSNIISGSSGLGRIRPSRFTEALVPAFASDIYSAAGGTTLTVASFGGRRYFGISTDGYFGPTADLDLVAEGELNLGRIRYGLLDAKIFADFSWRSDPLDGQISAEATYDTGATRSIGTQTSEGTVASGAFTLGAQPAEWAEPVFTFARSSEDPTLGPCLRWWILRAIPAGQTNERIILPLILKRDLRRPSGAGGKLDPRTELEFLRSLVLSTQIVTYQEGESSETVWVRNLEVQPTQWNVRDNVLESITLVELLTT